MPEGPYKLRVTHQKLRLPRRPENTELMGEYQDSGLEDVRFLVRRNDGQVILLTALLYHVLSAADGRRDLEAIAAEVRAAVDKPVTAENVSYLLDKLQPMGVIESRAAPAPKAERADPLLGLTFRATVSPPRLTNALGRVFRVLFAAPIVVAVLVSLVLADWWLIVYGHLTAGFVTVLTHPGYLLGGIGLLLAGTLWHEIGHASACRRGGGKPGAIGFGLYLMVPALFTEVSETYRMPRRARLCVDLGGIYFNAINIVVLAGVFYFTKLPFLALAVLFLHMEIIEQMLPIVRLDGYYVLSDWLGIPDLFARVGPTLRLLIPGHRNKHTRTGLVGKARVIVTAWVLLVVPALMLGMGYTLLHLREFVTKSWDGSLAQYHLIGHAAQRGQIVNTLIDTFGFLLVCLPLVGLILFALKAVRKGIKKLNRKKGQCVKESPPAS